MRPSGVRHLLAAALLALPLAEVGHTLAFVARYGPPGLELQTVGVHGYFPTALRLSAAGVGLTLLAAVCVLALGRILLGRGLGLTRTGGHPFLSLLLVATVVQLDVYLVQETVETVLAHEPYTFATLASALAWGLAGQLPVAAANALGLRWLSFRLEATIGGVRSAFQLSARLLRPVPPLAVAVRPAPMSRARVVGEQAGAAFAKRGPPAAAVT
ncbi:MAG: hypothetical protein J2P40_06720 [Candidatus Dormibacteraeota bacterium]|nr:hypothetical protein [Candidatus Dormibacteraeota bacterium]MBO0760949.1 hypothetical protein [Candidatus Dormibacteraeota bacterium]